MDKKALKDCRILLKSSISVLLALFLDGCSYRPVLKSPISSPPPSKLSGELRASVEQLAGNIGQRNLYHPEGLAAAADWIEAQFRSYGGLEVQRLAVPVQGKDFMLSENTTAWNIEAIAPGSNSDEILVVGAHYDSKVAMDDWHGHWPPLPDGIGTPGANDNASGVASVLVLAKTFAGTPRKRTIRFVAFVNEEPPFFETGAMGSTVYASALRRAGKTSVRMISLETLGCYSEQPHTKRISLASSVGLPDRADYVALLSDESSRKWTRHCADLIAENSTMEIRAVSLPAFLDRIAWSDDWSFWKAGYQAFSVTDTAYLRSDVYHEVSDTPEKLDYDSLSQVVWSLRALISALADEEESWAP